MAITLGTAARNAAADGVVDLVDAGAAAGKIRVRASTTTLCDITLADPAFGAASSGTASGSGLPKSGTASAAGTADNFQVLDSDNNVIYSGSVTATGGGGDATIDNTSISNGQTVNLTSLSFTQPAS